MSSPAPTGNKTSYLSSHEFRKSVWFGNGIAIFAVLLAWFATLLIHTISHEKTVPLIFFFAAVAISGGFGGVRSGLLATFMAAIISDFFFLPPFYSLQVAREDIPLLILFIFVALLVNALSGKLQFEKTEANQRFERLVEDLDGIVWEANPSSFQFTFVSKRAESILGYPLSMWFNDDNIRKLFTCPDHYENVQKELDKALGSGGIHAFEYLASSIDGRYVWIHETLNIQMNAENTPMRISGLCVDITEQVRLLDEVEKSRTHLRQLSRSLVEVQESERHEIAKELHDEIGQVLTGLKLKIEMSMRTAPAPIQNNLREALAVLSDLMQRVSELSLNLRPAMLDDLGLLPALIWQFERYTTLTGVQVDFDHTPLGNHLPHEVETTAYRIIQEALTNVARHAGVNEVIVRVWTTQNSLGLQVADHGKGFNRDEVKTSMKIGGLAGMEERAGLIGGWVTLESSSQTGTCLTAELPLEDSMEDDG